MEEIAPGLGEQLNLQDMIDHQHRVDEVMATMRAAVQKAQAASLKNGVPISYLIDGVMHFELPSGEITRENPWTKSPPDVPPG